MGCTQGAATCDDETRRNSTGVFQRITTSDVEEAPKEKRIPSTQKMVDAGVTN